MKDSPFRDLPAVHRLLRDPILAEVLDVHGREPVLRAIRSVLERARTALRSGRVIDLDSTCLAQQVKQSLREDPVRPRHVINATGILLHTGLGRAPLAKSAIEAVSQAARGYCDLEFDLSRGGRGVRTASVAERLKRLTGAEAAIVVNNNAAATVLALRALASGREVIVSRGQLVEIGGSFRLPEILEVSGARLREVGTTNRTRRSDYENAIGSETAALLRVHPSNYQISGFTESVGIAELVALGRDHGLLVIDDIGSGALAPGQPPIGPGEPTLRESVAAGADLVLCSGDKLLGGPQCGLLVGRHEAIDRASSDPLMRALRVDKLTLCALDATLRLAEDPDRARRDIPLWAFLDTPVAALHDRANRLATLVRAETTYQAETIATTAYLGGGSAPFAAIPSFAIRITRPFPENTPTERILLERLRGDTPPIIGRIQDGCVVIDLKAVAACEDQAIVNALRAIEHVHPRQIGS